ncbi:MAG: hypothetical protein WA160_05140 [Pseudobdellovibrio sp.]
MKKIILSLLIIANFSCAKNNGTNTGNPENQGQQGAPEPACGAKQKCLPTQYVLMMNGAIASKVENCKISENHETASDTYKAIFSQAGLNLELPVAEINFEELDQSFHAKKLTIDTTSFNQCLDILKNLSCDSNDFKLAYDNQIPTDYSSIHKIFRASPTCLTMFADKE